MHHHTTTTTATSIHLRRASSRKAATLGRWRTHNLYEQQEDDLGLLWHFFETTPSLQRIGLSTAWGTSPERDAALCSRAAQAPTRNVHGVLQELQITASMILLSIPLLDLLNLLQSPQSTLQTLKINCCWNIAQSTFCEILRERIRTAFASNMSLRRLVLHEEAEETSEAANRTVLFLESLHFLTSHFESSRGMAPC
jgi:hypothetical protein